MGELADEDGSEMVAVGSGGVKRPQASVPIPKFAHPYGDL
jgi:hypothetical protein